MIDDVQLVLGVSRGDQSSFKQIFDKYYRDMVIRAYQILQDEQLSKDAAQEVFLELWKNRSRLGPHIILHPYLKRSVSNRAINVLKSRRHHQSSGPEPLKYLNNTDDDASEFLEQQELKDMIHSAIDRLPERCRLIFVLCRQEGLSHKEISDKLDISVKTIENQMTKAIRTLREVITKYQSELLGFLLISISTKWGFIFFQLLIS